MKISNRFICIQIFLASRFISTITEDTINRKNKQLTDYRCPPCQCGKKSIYTRIVGGHVTKLENHPWLAALIAKNGSQIPFCGATLISDQFVLTASHCVSGIRPFNIEVVIFNKMFNQFEDSYRTVGVSKIFVYPRFGYMTKFNNDIALIKLDRTLRLENNGLTPICLPKPGKSFSGRKALIVGYGRTGEDTKISSIHLNEAIVNIISFETCTQLYSPRQLSQNMICAGYVQGGIDSCQGDSGGPLIINEYDKLTIAGIVSWGIGCARPSKPGVYTKVNNYLNWIINLTRNSCYCL